MAHALKRISYATSDLQHNQFCFLAREPNGHYTNQFCHLFITSSAQQVRNQNNYYFLFTPAKVSQTNKRYSTVDEVRTYYFRENM